ncbi:hypothetical protein H8B06_11475 [Sphingobacterium sp. DN00404]|uniref:Uncharacterized protein n=1 Tax=Sphingobacterium micropteri TaxID=2763501 RepID=A0ABR7YQ60_9SPHI|nr:hypothetical protein [Sphingobacterium micropteri]MBD1433450.1 hypothetical protein [Sphingobacterium micropteri]
MKHLLSMLLFALLLSACSDKENNELEPKHISENPSISTTMKLKLNAASLTAFAAQNVSAIDVFVYLGDSLVFGKNLALGDGNLQIEVPLGESLKTFAVANAGEIIDPESLQKVLISQDVGSQKEIYVSALTTFMSDKTVSTVNLELKRMVGQAVFQPVEAVEELTGITTFDALDVHFNNVVIGYMPGANRFVMDKVIVRTNMATGFKASVYSFPTPDANLGNIEVVYLNEGSEVNRTLRPLSVAIKYESSKRTVVNMPILNPAFLAHKLSASSRSASSGTSSGVTFQEYQF